IKRSKLVRIGDQSHENTQLIAKTAHIDHLDTLKQTLNTFSALRINLEIGLKLLMVRVKVIWLSSYAI
ncbi:hypothetical protein, partial [Pseudoalteromonas sp. APC 3694]|uniref:hypothetical protein n=1 Tax=Pseudoalteromonas sp. APC 3694 TaxID=3035202 RepID=UPI0025B3CD6B